MKKKKANAGKRGKAKARANAAFHKPLSKAEHGKRHGRLVRSTIVAIALIAAMLLGLKLLSIAFPSLSGDLASAANGWGLFGVFALIFLGSSLLPFPTDAVFVVLVSSSSQPVPIVLVSIVASFISGMVNYGLAYALTKGWVEKQMGKETVEEAKEWLDSWGAWAIIIFGMIPNPLIDTMTFVAGLGKMNLRKFAFYSAIARALHFGLLAYLALQTKLL